MTLIKNILFFLFIIFSTLTLKAQDCQTHETNLTQKEIEAIPGETMGQKLESLLFWSQEERQRRFPIMHDIFPSIPVLAAAQAFPLEEANNITPQWKDKTTLASYIDDNHIGGVIALQDNKIILEQYADGIDQQTLWTSFSVAKSVSSILLGVALKEGSIESLDDALERYIPDLEGYDYGKVTVGQLLTMTSGIGWNEDYEDPQSDVAQMYQSPCHNNEAHILTYMKSLEFTHEPGTHWNYSTGETDLVGILVQKATEKSLAEYLSEKIWQPWGMEHCAYWLADECSSLNIGGSGLSASLRDYARLGTLMLNNGKRGDKVLLSEEYLDNATALLYETNGQGGGYGYLWWRFKDGSYAAVGIFGQMLYIDPNKDLVIAQFAAWPRASSRNLTQGRSAFIDAVHRAIDN